VNDGIELELNPQFVLDNYHRILDDSVRQQYTHSLNRENEDLNKQLTIAHLGDSYSYSYLAVERHFANYPKPFVGRGFDHFREIFNAVSNEECHLGLLPFENTTSGTINEIHDLLREFQLYIVGEESVAIRHCLIGFAETELHKIKDVYSHPQALAQSGKFLQMYPNIHANFYSSTSTAVNYIKEQADPGKVAIASREAAMHAGLSILAEDIGNQAQNFTRFLILARNPVTVPKTLPAKTSMVFSTEQRAGTLVDVLGVFKEFDINMTKLTSRPIPGKPWAQQFFVDFQGNQDNEEIAQAIQKIAETTPDFRIFGSYPEHSLDPTMIQLENQ
jgi:chorismate mutase/prephenate dehydratase